ncbi:Alpha/Beta hydrolase protein [Gymnopilus junonius]|uniref:Alpha/Beta hydrolase protein n=1 Tax=Gymnopilus junonius TaxID=109634 RepID=A0A9P5TP94_GYMJU|nr:Alpha/Beta hydrolase protein [Gymnopilus junonius]
MAGSYFFFRAQKYLVAFGGLYLALVVLLTIPSFQSHALYLNAIKIPLFADFDTPEKYGLAPNRTINLKIQTPDNETLGAWFILSENYYKHLPSIPTNPTEHITPALASHPAILFFHGNAATRAFSARVQHYEAFSTRLGASVLAIDYRGFADSSGKPSEKGLVTDAKAAFDWLVAHGKQPEDILVVGHSLGTGVSGQLGAKLASEGVKPKGIVLLSPFSSIHEVLETYHMFGFIPLIKPIAVIPGAAHLLKSAVVHRFDTLQAVPNITAPVLIAHAENDWDIPDSHSDALFQAFLDPHLPPVDTPENPFSTTQEEWNVVTKQQAARTKKREEIVKSTTINRFGRVDEFVDAGHDRKIVLVKTLAGGHDYLGVQEGLVDIIGKNFEIL